MTTTASGRKTVILTLFLLSGCAGLIYEVVWTRELVFVFGGTTYAITTILVGFMSGLGLGSYIGGRLSERLRRPGRVYGALEILVGLYALLVPALFHLADPIYRAAYPHLGQTPWLLTAARFGIGFVVLLLPTTCMGATLPIVVRHVTTFGGDLGRSVGLLYGINTLGAVVGTMAAGFWLLPAVGLTHTTWAAAALNLLVGSAAIALLRQPATGTPAKETRPVVPASTRATAPPAIPSNTRRAILVAFAVSGFAAMVYQIAWTRVLLMSLGSSTYAFTCILTAFILGLAVGSLAVARWVDRWKNPALVFGCLEIAIGLSAVLIAPMYGRAPTIVYNLVQAYRGRYGLLLSTEFTLVIAVTFVPTLLMGAIFPLVTRAVAGRREEAGAATGRAYAVNTLGTIIGSFLAGFVMIRGEVLGVQGSIVAAAVLNAVVGAAVILLSGSSTAGAWAAKAIASVAAVLLVPAVAIGAGQWNLGLLLTAPFYAQMEPASFAAKQRVVYFGDGVDLTVAVTQVNGMEDALALSVNGKVDASNDFGDVVTQLIVGHIPPMLVDGGRDACIIGLGSGMTLGAIACYPSYEHLDCVEISEDVIKAAAYFAPYNRQILTNDPRLRMIRADGRNHLLLTDREYDLIVSEPSNPWMSGVANLFTREFFSICRNRLTDKGLLCVWLQSYMMSLEDFRMVVRTLFDVFEDVSIWQLGGSNYLLVASPRSRSISLEGVLRRLAVPAVREDLFRVGIIDAGQVLGRYITSGPPLRDWASSAAVHTDDNARLEFSAPRQMYSGANDTIDDVVAGLQGSPFEALLTPVDNREATDAIRQRAEACGRARRMLAEANDHRRKGDAVAALARLVAAHQQDPGDVELHRLMVERREELRKQYPQLADQAAVQPILRQAERFRRPAVAPIRGASTAEFVDLLRRRAWQAAEQGRPDWAAEYLLDAHRAAPADETLPRTRDDPRLKALIEQHSQTRPASGPS